MDPAALLRPGLLAGRVIAFGGLSHADAGPHADAASHARAPHAAALAAHASAPHAAALAALGADTVVLPATLDEDAALAQARAALTAHGSLDVLVHDLRPAFGSGGQDGLRAALDGAWVTLRAVANAAWVEQERDGRIVLLAPAAREHDPHAAAVRAAAENTARTLSIEWSRHGVRSVAIAPGPHTTEAELASLAAYLASPAGDYFSGALLSLGEASPAARS